MQLYWLLKQMIYMYVPPGDAPDVGCRKYPWNVVKLLPDDTA
jgi:hypothetical protein